MHYKKSLILTLPILLSLSCKDDKKKVRSGYIEAKGNSTDSVDPNSILNKKACTTEFIQHCAEIQSKIDKNLDLIAQNAKSGNSLILYEEQLNLNELLEIRDSYQNSQLDISAITQRYKALRDIAASNGSNSPAISALSYQNEELAATREVFKVLGELYLNPSEVAETEKDQSKIKQYQASVGSLPWAAYWYPKQGKEMFESIDSPLQKLDHYLKNQGKSSAIGNWEFEHYDSGAAEWEGMCDAWSLASISTIEPKKSQQIDGISFSVSDLKALAIKYYESYKPQIFGRRYQGSASTDGQIQDLRPEAFHRIVEEYIGKRQVPIIIDEDPGIEIWSKPMFRMSFIIYKDPQVSHAFLVKAYPWLIRQRDSVEEAPTSMTKDLEAPSYEYRLYYDPQPEADGRLRIIAGEWLGASLNSHPDMVYIPLESTNQRQTNPEISKNSSEIRKLLERAGMFKSQPGPEL